MSYLLFPFIILQTCCAAFQFRQIEPAISPNVIAENSFAVCNYLHYPLLMLCEGLLLLLELLSVIGGQAREIENNMATDHGDLISD